LLIVVCHFCSLVDSLLPETKEVNVRVKNHAKKSQFFDPDGGPGGLHNASAQPAVTMSDGARETLASALIVAWSELGPTDQMGSSRKTTHVSPNLGQQHFSRAPVDTRDGVEQ